MRRTENDKILSDYFRKKSSTNEPIPYMTIIQKETGVSNSTISRFAIRKGFYNFAEMRAKFNQSTESSDFSDHGLLSFLNKVKKNTLYLTSSKSTRILALHLQLRLENIGIKVEILENNINLENNFKTIKETDSLLFFSISGETNSFFRWTSLNKSTNTAFISTIKTKAKNDKTSYVTLTKYKPLSLSKLDTSESVRKIFVWLDQIINIYQIENSKKH